MADYNWRPGQRGQTATGNQPTQARIKEAEEKGYVWNAIAGRFELPRGRSQEVGRMTEQERIRQDAGAEGYQAILAREAEQNARILEQQRAEQGTVEEPSPSLATGQIRTREQAAAVGEGAQTGRSSVRSGEIRTGEQSPDEIRQRVQQATAQPSTLSQQPSGLLGGEGVIEQSPEVRMERLAALKERAETDIMSLTDEEIDELVALQREMESRRGSR